MSRNRKAKIEVVGHPYQNIKTYRVEESTQGIEQEIYSVLSSIPGVLRVEIFPNGIRILKHDSVSWERIEKSLKNGLKKYLNPKFKKSLFCPYCKNKLNPGNKFCTHCGKKKRKKERRGPIGWLAGAILFGLLGCFLIYSLGFCLIDGWNKAQEERNSHCLDNGVFRITALYDEEFGAFRKTSGPEETIEKIVERVSQSWEWQVGTKFVLKEVSQFNIEATNIDQIFSSLYSNYPAGERNVVIVFSGKYLGAPIVQTCSSANGNYFLISYPSINSGERRINLFFWDPYFINRSAYLLNQELGKAFGFIEIKEPNIAIPDFQTAEDYQKFKNEILKKETRNYFKQLINGILPFTTNLGLDNQRISELSSFARQMGYDTGFDNKYSPNRQGILYEVKRLVELNTFKKLYQGSRQEGILAAEAVKEKEGLRNLVLKDPAYEEMMSFIKEDSTNERLYQLYVYMCCHYSLDTVNHAKAKEIRAGYVRLDFPGTPAPGAKIDPTAHAIICFNTADRGLVFVEPQTDKEVKVEIGKSYWGQSGLGTSSYDDTIIGVEITWPDGTKTVITEN